MNSPQKKEMPHKEGQPNNEQHLSPVDAVNSSILSRILGVPKEKALRFFRMVTVSSLSMAFLIACSGEKPAHAQDTGDTENTGNPDTTLESTSKEAQDLAEAVASGTLTTTVDSESNLISGTQAAGGEGATPNPEEAEVTYPYTATLKPGEDLIVIATNKGTGVLRTDKTDNYQIEVIDKDGEKLVLKITWGENGENEGSYKIEPDKIIPQETKEVTAGKTTNEQTDTQDAETESIQVRRVLTDTAIQLIDGTLTTLLEGSVVQASPQVDGEQQFVQVIESPSDNNQTVGAPSGAAGIIDNDRNLGPDEVYAVIFDEGATGGPEQTTEVVAGEPIGEAVETLPWETVETEWSEAITTLPAVTYDLPEEPILEPTKLPTTTVEAQTGIYTLDGNGRLNAKINGIDFVYYPDTGWEFISDKFENISLMVRTDFFDSDNLTPAENFSAQEYNYKEDKIVPNVGVNFSNFSVFYPGQEYNSVSEIGNWLETNWNFTFETSMFRNISPELEYLYAYSDEQITNGAQLIQRGYLITKAILYYDKENISKEELNDYLKMEAENIAPEITINLNGERVILPPNVEIHFSALLEGNEEGLQDNDGAYSFMVDQMTIEGSNLVIKIPNSELSWRSNGTLIQQLRRLLTENGITLPTNSEGRQTSGTQNSAFFSLFEDQENVGTMFSFINADSDSNFIELQ